MRDDGLHQSLADASTTKFRKHEDVSEVGERREIAYHPSIADLSTSDVGAETNRVFDRLARLFQCSRFCPIRFLGQKIVNQAHIQPLLVRADLEVLTFHSLKSFSEEIPLPALR